MPFLAGRRCDTVDGSLPAFTVLTVVVEVGGELRRTLQRIGQIKPNENLVEMLADKTDVLGE